MKQQLTTKDLTVISELLNLEQNLYKQCVHNSQCLSDKSSKDLCSDIACAHRARFDQLLSLLA